MNYNPYGFQFPGGVPSQPFASPMGAQPQPVMQAPAPICRPVASREEAFGVPVDFMGALMVFPDLGHGRIYLKRFNANTGAADFMEFEPVRQAPEEPVSDPLEGIRAEIAALSAKIDQLTAKRKGKTNDPEPNDSLS